MHALSRRPLQTDLTTLARFSLFAIFAIFCALSVVSCGSSNDSKTETTPTPNEGVTPEGKPTQPTHRYYCRRPGDHPGAGYELILITQDAKLPENVGAIALKKGQDVLVKVAAHMSYVSKAILQFEEIGNASPKLVQMSFDSKLAVISGFGMSDLPDGTQFTCE